MEFCGCLAQGRADFVKNQVVSFRCHADGFKIGTVLCNEKSLARPWRQRNFPLERREIDSIMDDGYIVYGGLQITRYAGRAASVNSNVSSYAGDRRR